MLLHSKDNHISCQRTENFLEAHRRSLVQHNVTNCSTIRMITKDFQD
jgi:hypothetical protein